MAQHVRQRLLHHPAQRQADNLRVRDLALRQRRLDREPGGPEFPDHVPDPGHARHRRRRRIVTQRPHDPAYLLEGLRADLLDRRQDLRPPVRRPTAEHDTRPGLHVDQRQAVRQHIMDLPRDTRTLPLARRLLLRHQVPLRGPRAARRDEHQAQNQPLKRDPARRLHTGGALEMIGCPPPQQRGEEAPDGLNCGEDTGDERIGAVPGRRVHHHRHRDQERTDTQVRRQRSEPVHRPCHGQDRQRDRPRNDPAAPHRERGDEENREHNPDQSRRSWHCSGQCHEQVKHRQHRRQCSEHQVKTAEPVAGGARELRSVGRWFRCGPHGRKPRRAGAGGDSYGAVRRRGMIGVWVAGNVVGACEPGGRTEKTQVGVHHWWVLTRTDDTQRAGCSPQGPRVATT